MNNLIATELTRKVKMNGAQGLVIGCVKDPLVSHFASLGADICAVGNDGVKREDLFYSDMIRQKDFDIHVRFEVDHDLAFKLTGGLHHAFSHTTDEGEDQFAAPASSS